MKSRLTILFIKIEIIIKKLFKNESPSFIALIFYKKILNTIILPKNIILISNNEPNSINIELSSILKDLNYKVLSNAKKAYDFKDIITFIISNSKKNSINVDFLVLNVNILKINTLLKYITPTYFIINDTYINLTLFKRKKLFKDINNLVNKDTKFILNSNNINLFNFKEFNKSCVYYSSDIIHNNYNKMSCPNCGRKIKYNISSGDYIGSFVCEKCGVKNNLCKFIASNIHFDLNYFYINKLKFKLNNNLYNEIYIKLILFIMLRNINIMDTDIQSILNNKVHSIDIKKNYFNNMEMVIYNNKIIDANVYNNIISHITNCPSNKIIIFGFSPSVYNYDLKDISWLYDIDFELLIDDYIDKIILVGPLSKQLAIRLSYSFIDNEKIITVDDLNKLHEVIDFSKNCKLFSLIHNDLFNNINVFTTA